jgi:hypothetical protein
VILDVAAHTVGADGAPGLFLGPKLPPEVFAFFTVAVAAARPGAAALGGTAALLAGHELRRMEAGLTDPASAAHAREDRYCGTWRPRMELACPAARVGVWFVLQLVG